MTLTYPDYRTNQIYPHTPVSEYEQLISSAQVVAIGTNHPESTLPVLLTVLEKYPDVLLSISDAVDKAMLAKERARVAMEEKRRLPITGETGAETTLRIANFLHSLRRLLVNVSDAESYDALRQLSQLEWLTLNSTKKNLSIEFIKNLIGLQKVRVTGRPRNIEVLADLPVLDQLTLAQFKGSLDFLAGHARLRSLSVGAMGLVDFTVLPTLPALVDLCIVQQGRTVTDLQAFVPLRGVKTLCLRSLNKMENINFVADMPELQYLHLEDCHSIASLQPLTQLPNLHVLTLFGVKPKDKDVMCLLECKALREIYSVGFSIPENMADRFNDGFRGEMLYANGWYRGSNFRVTGLPPYQENPGKPPLYEFYRSCFHENMPSGYPGY